MAAALLAALVLGTPLALAAWVGYPLPRSWPSLAEISRAITDGAVPEQTWRKALAVVCWFAWAELTVALAVEVVATVRGRPSPRVPLIGIFQGVAAALVATALPALAGFGRAGEADVAPPPLSTAAVPLPPAAPVTLVESPPREAPPDQTPDLPADVPQHVVGRRETLWSVAEDRLGDALRWREIYELNAGRVQWDGDRLSRSDQRVREGWVLLLPPDAVSPVATEATATPTSDVSPADTALRLHQAAAEAAGAADAAEAEWRAIVDSLTQPDEDPLPEPAAPALSDVIDDAPGPVREGSLLDGLSGAGLLAGGLVWTLERVRRAVERRRLPGAAVARRSGDARRLEMSVRAASLPDLVTFTDLALRAWSASLRADGRTPPAVIGINVAEELSLLFASPDREPVAGFTVEDDGLSWVTSMWGDLPALEEGAAQATRAPLPGLVTIGHTEQSQVLLNLHALGHLSVVGEDADVAETMFAMATELATGPWREDLDVVLVGVGAELSELPTVTVVASVEDLDELFGDRAATPTVVLAADVSVAEAARLCTLVNTAADGGLAAVIAHHGDVSEWTLSVHGSDVRLEPVGVALARHRLPIEARPLIGELVCTRGDGGANDDDPDRVGVAPHGAAAFGDDEPRVEVQVLGPVAVVGAAGEFPRRKALELVAYLAIHRQGADADAVAEALWPDRLASPRTLHGVSTLARRALGSDPDGRPLLPHATPDGRYQVDSAVSLDLDRFEAWIGRAAQASPDVAAGYLRRALGLVRGRPFTVSGGEYLWVHAEALMTAAVAAVADAAHQLAHICLEAGDHRGAWWATQQGLLASPGNEQLYRDRMAAADAAGNPAGVEAVMDELCRALEVTRTEAHAALHPMTVELYERLTRRSGQRVLASRG